MKSIFKIAPYREPMLLADLSGNVMFVIQDQSDFILRYEKPCVLDSFSINYIRFAGSRLPMDEEFNNDAVTVFTYQISEFNITVPKDRYATFHKDRQPILGCFYYCNKGVCLILNEGVFSFSDMKFYERSGCADFGAISDIEILLK
jgi:hypothetical protein